MRHGLRRLHEHGAAPDGHREREAGCPITMADWDAASARTPHLVKLAPSGPRPLIDLYEVPAACRRSWGSWGGWGCSTRARVTCMGASARVPGEMLPHRPTARCAARTTNPFSAQGALKVLLRQHRARRLGGEEVGGRSVHVMPHRAGARVRLARRRPARPSTAARSPRAMWWSSATRGRPRAARACARCSRPRPPSADGAVHQVALITDGRFSGATKGPAVGHVSPEAAAGGPIALIEEGDPSPWTSRAAR